MSHLSKVKTQFKSVESLRKAMDQLGCDLRVGDGLHLNMRMRVDGDKNEAVDMIAQPRNEREQDFMGFKKQEDGTYNLIGDDYCCRNFKISPFGKDLSKKYAEVEVLTQFEQNDQLNEFDMVNREINDKGEVVLTFQRWA